MSDVVLHIEHLNKHLGRRQILHDISFDTYAGEVFGFLGPNGAGKTTTIKIAAGLLTLDEGEISVCGYDMRRQFEQAMANVGGIVENPEFYKYLSGLENLRQYAAMRSGVTEERIREVVRLVGLENRIKDKVGKYSLGMRQRLGVAQAILHHPKLLILDEPTNGLDPAGIKDLRDILKNLAHREGVAVFVSSHLMSEMEMMCDRVGIIVNGRLHSVHTVQEMISSKETYDEYHLLVDAPDRALQLLSFLPQECASVEDGMLAVRLARTQEGEEELLPRINRTLVLGGISLYTVTKRESRSLEDVFIELTGEGGAQIE
jgi:ABC-2 type transport system ATP-binding protein